MNTQTLEARAQEIYGSKEYLHALAVVESAVAVGTLDTPYATKALSTYLRLFRKATRLMDHH